jgi:cAMP-dependent protein kinase regulator
MTARRSIRDLERQCKKEPDNLVVRLLLAAAYREAGRTTDAIPLYRSVASAYQRQGRRTQAVAVLRSLLELDPLDPDTRSLLAQIDQEAARPDAPPSMPPPLQPPTDPRPDGVPVRPTIPNLQASTVRRSTPAPYPDRTPTGTGAGKLAPPAVAGAPPRRDTPVRPPGVPSTLADPSPGSTLTGLGAAGAGRRLATPTRGSAPLYTPTPLPAPVPFHDGDATTDIEPIASIDLGDDGDEATRVVGSQRGAVPPPLRPVSEGAAAPDDLAADVETRRHRRLSEHELELVSQPPPTTDLVPRVDTAELDAETNPDASPPVRATTSDDEQTRVADGRATPPHGHRPPRPSNEFEGPTDVRDRGARRKPTSRRTIRGRAASVPDAPAAGSPRRATTRDDPTGPVPRPTGRPDGGAPPRRLATPADRPTPPPARPAPTGPATPTGRPPVPLADRPTPPPMRATVPLALDGPGGAGADEPTDVHGDAPTRISEPGMHRSRTFRDSFVSTLELMDPDGSAIEAPLDMFSMLPQEALAELGRRMKLRSYAADEVIVREGDPGDACYVIADGEVRVLKCDPLHPEAGLVEVARLGSRSLFGEFALLADRRRHATVQATTQCDVYEIPRQLLRELAASFPEVGPALDSFYRQRLLATLLRTAPFFSPLPEEHRARLLARFVPIRAESGETIVREGQPAGGLYLIVIGAVEITRRVGKQRSVILASLREGAYFGEMSLLSGDPTSATVIAVGAVELALLPPRDFYEIVSEHPQLWASIRREAKSRALLNARLLAGVSGSV